MITSTKSVCDIDGRSISKTKQLFLLCIGFIFIYTIYLLAYSDKESDMSLIETDKNINQQSATIKTLTTGNANISTQHGHSNYNHHPQTTKLINTSKPLPSLQNDSDSQQAQQAHVQRQQQAKGSIKLDLNNGENIIITNNTRSTKLPCGKNDTYCKYGCTLCNLLIPENIRYAFIEHHKSGNSISTQIQDTIGLFCKCIGYDYTNTSHIVELPYQLNRKTKQRLFGENNHDQHSQINAVYSKHYIVKTLAFDDNYNSNINSLIITGLNTSAFLQRINNSVWFHFTRKPISTIMSAFHYHAQCAEPWDQKPLSKTKNGGKPRWRGDKIYQYIMNKTIEYDLNLNDTLHQFVLNTFSKDNIESFFHIFYNKAKAIEILKNNSKNNNIFNSKYKYYKFECGEEGLFYFNNSVVAQREAPVSTCLSGNYFSKLIYNEIAPAIKDPFVGTDIQGYSGKRRLKHGRNFNSKSKFNARRDGLCHLYGREYRKYQNSMSIDDNACNFGLFYETIRYAQCEWLDFFTVHTLSKLLENNLLHYKDKYGLNIDILQFEMAQWQNYDSFVKNIDIIVEKLNIIDSKENQKKIQNYFKNIDDVDENQIQISHFRQKLLSELYSLSIANVSTVNKKHVTFDKYDTKKELVLFLRYHHVVCTLIKNLTLGLYFQWEYSNIC